MFVLLYVNFPFIKGWIALCVCTTICLSIDKCCSRFCLSTAVNNVAYAAMQILYVSAFNSSGSILYVELQGYLVIYSQFVFCGVLFLKRHLASVTAPFCILASNAQGSSSSTASSMLFLFGFITATHRAISIVYIMATLTCVSQMVHQEPFFKELKTRKLNLQRIRI